MSEPSTVQPDTLRRSRLTWPTVLIAWVLTRAAMLLIWTQERSISGDVRYYWSRVSTLPEVGLEQTLIEYPTPVVGILGLPKLLTGGSLTGYFVGFIVMMLALDAVLTWLLWLRGGHHGARGVLFWIVFVFLVGPLCYARFDMIPAVLAGVALLLLSRRPGVAGALIALGAAIKLWPALLLPALLGKRDGVKRAGLSFLATGVGLAGISWLVGGWDRLLSPLTWQSDRGLQIESVWATPVMLNRLVGSDHTITMSKYQAYEIFGPGVDLMTAVSTMATVAGLVVIAGLALRVLHGRESSLTTSALLMVSIVGLTIVGNKTLSPQYVLWLGGPLAVLLLGHRVDGDRPAWLRNSVLRLAGTSLLVAALTQIVYPLTYGAVVFGQPGPPLTVALTALAARNLLIVVITVWAVILTWRSAGLDPLRRAAARR